MVVLSLVVNIAAIGYFPNVLYRAAAVAVISEICRIDPRSKNAVQLKASTVGAQSRQSWTPYVIFEDPAWLT